MPLKIFWGPGEGTLTLEVMESIPNQSPYLPPTSAVNFASVGPVTTSRKPFLIPSFSTELFPYLAAH